MKSRVEENKEIIKAYEELVGLFGQVTSLELLNSAKLSIIGTALIDISKSLAVIADAMSKEESTTASLKIEPRRR